jgi:hypothetical protein
MFMRRELLMMSLFPVLIVIASAQISPSQHSPKLIGPFGIIDPGKIIRFSENQVSLPTSSEIADTRAVYEVILKMDYYRSRKIVLEEMTNRGGSLMDSAVADRNIDNLERSTIKSFELRNKSSSSLRGVLYDRNDVVFFTTMDRRALAQDKAPFEDSFKRRFPGSRRIISLSKVGFGTYRREALAYVSYYCGIRCAGGSFIILKKIRNKWSVAAEKQMWIS